MIVKVENYQYVIKMSGWPHFQNFFCRTWYVAVVRQCRSNCNSHDAPKIECDTLLYNNYCICFIPLVTYTHVFVQSYKEEPKLTKEFKYICFLLCF
jgi:hypothetical protein